MQAPFPLSCAVLSKIVVLLSVALPGREEHAPPHGEVLASHPNESYSNHDHAHPLESIHLWDDCMNKTDHQLTLTQEAIKMLSSSKLYILETQKNKKKKTNKGLTDAEVPVLMQRCQY